MSGNWKNVEKKHIIKAIQIYNEEGIMAYSKNTFLIYNNGRYPAKHIRALAYEVAFGVIAVKSTFSGGKETAQFFERLGFEVDYNGKDRNTVITDETNKPKEKDKKSRRCLGVVEQKNALQLHLNRYFNGDVVSEKTYDWMKTPHLKEPSIEYKKLINSLREYQGN